ncbi:hypothetical protein C0J52_07750 [Blattella germanica]|nr:hypothetical protein C0J52_07750 [Blattella germanica]
MWAGFPCEETFIEHDEVKENLIVIAELCKDLEPAIETQDVINFDNDLATTQNIERDIDSLNETRGETSKCEGTEIAEEETEEDASRELNICSYKQALLNVNDLQEFAASHDDPALIDLLQDVENHILARAATKTRQSTLLQLWNNTYGADTVVL